MEIGTSFFTRNYFSFSPLLVYTILCEVYLFNIQKNVLNKKDFSINLSFSIIRVGPSVDGSYRRFRRARIGIWIPTFHDYF